ncbi:hypothetical protein ALC57_03999 [Trachymyrmex cornetzi]|uniref:Uncharacterized protein n=1 Tax=Trachymyrmex cornetzi TaxID=471704 RepID=A0A151JLF2_9HYME|nr:hypothetical protein ALC57_03999 [Trachymyrmex cornetzi]
MTVRFRKSLDGSRDKYTLGARVIDFKFVNCSRAQPLALTTPEIQHSPSLEKTFFSMATTTLRPTTTTPRLGTTPSEPSGT